MESHLGRPPPRPVNITTPGRLPATESTRGWTAGCPRSVDGNAPDVASMLSHLAWFPVGKGLWRSQKRIRGTRPRKDTRWVNGRQLWAQGACSFLERACGRSSTGTSKRGSGCGLPSSSSSPSPRCLDWRLLSSQGVLGVGGAKRLVRGDASVVDLAVYSLPG
jgi:hypothetical protein